MLNVKHKNTVDCKLWPTLTCNGNNVRSSCFLLYIFTADPHAHFLPKQQMHNQRIILIITSCLVQNTRQFVFNFMTANLLSTLCPKKFLRYKKQYLLGYIEGCANEYKNNNCKSMQLSIKQWLLSYTKTDLGRMKKIIK